MYLIAEDGNQPVIIDELRTTVIPPFKFLYEQSSFVC